MTDITSSNEQAPADPSESQAFSPEKAGLNTINDDCLLVICQYLNLLDAQNLASTCYRQQEFANAFVIPKLSKHVKLNIVIPQLTVLNSTSSVVTIDEFSVQFAQISTFVEHLTLSGYGPIHTESWQKFERILELCVNLQTLRIQNIQFETDGHNILNYAPIHIKELHLINCRGVTDDWSTVFKRFYDLNEITVTGCFNKISGVFFENFTKLKFLAVQDYHQFRWFLIEELLEQIFEHNKNTLRTLRLVQLRHVNSDSIFGMISDKLPKLESLEIENEMSKIWPKNVTLKIRNLKILKLHCSKLVPIDSLMRTLSDWGEIEELTITNGHFSGEKIEPLHFNKIKKLQWASNKSCPEFLKLITDANMPELRKFFFSNDLMGTASNKYRGSDDIVKFIESKKLLKNVAVVGHYDPFLLVLKITEMLKSNSGKGRLVLRLDISGNFDKEEVRKHLYEIYYYNLQPICNIC